MAINSRRKGGKNERMIAKALQDWTGKTFSKTPASGGLNWKKANVAGDVVCTKEGHFFPFCIEGKFYDKIDFSHLLNPKVKNVDILDFWNQAERDAKKCNKIPILMMRYNNMPKGFWFLSIPIDFLLYIQIKGYDQLFPCLLYAKAAKEGFVIIPSTVFFKLPYKEIKLLAKKFIKDEISKR